MNLSPVMGIIIGTQDPFLHSPFISEPAGISGMWVPVLQKYIWRELL